MTRYQQLGLLRWGLLSYLLLSLPPGLESRKRTGRRTESGTRRGSSSRLGCGPCDRDLCSSLVTSTPCRRIRDDCDCCLVCADDPLHGVRLEQDDVTATSLQSNTPRPGKQLHPRELSKQLAQQGMSDQPMQLMADDGDGQITLHSTDNDLCKNLECPKQQICKLNIQGLPVCRCPSRYYCRRSQPRRAEVCGDDGITYDNDCVLRATACASEKKIRIEHQGQCRTVPTGSHSPSGTVSEESERHGGGKKEHGKRQAAKKA